MDCKDRSKLMTDLLAGELDDASKAELLSHIESCPDCKAEFEELKTVWGIAESSLKGGSSGEKLSFKNYEAIFAAAKKNGKDEAKPERKGFFKVLTSSRAAFYLAACAMFVVLIGALLPALNSLKMEGRIPAFEDLISIREKLAGVASTFGANNADCANLSAPGMGRVDTQLLDSVPLAPTPSVIELNVIDETPAPEPPLPAAISAPRKSYGAKAAKPAADGARLNAASTPALEGEKSSGAAFGYGGYVGGAYPSATQSPAPSRSQSQPKVAAPAEAPAAAPAASGAAPASKVARDYGDEKLELGFAAGRSEVSVKKAPESKERLRESRTLAKGEDSKSDMDTSAVAQQQLMPMHQAAHVAPKAKEGMAKSYKTAAVNGKEVAAADKVSDGLLLNTGLRLKDAETGSLGGERQLQAAEQVLVESKSELKPDAAAKKVEIFKRKIVPAGAAANEEIQKDIQAVDKVEPLKEKNYKLNLKLWDMTTVEDARSFLSKKDVKLAPDAIKVDKSSGSLTIKAGEADIEKIDKVVEELKEREDDLSKFRDGIPMIDTKMKPVSTFSIDVDTASYTLTRKLLLEGRRPEPDAVRPEEFINYFDYHYRSPENTVFSVHLEAAPSPFRPGNFELMVGVQSKSLGPEAGKPSSFTVFVDTSGSMAQKSRMDIARKCLDMLVGQMKAGDSISLIACGPDPEILLDKATATSAPVNGELVSYTVQRGDTLWKISKMYGVGVDELSSCNQIGSAKNLKIGQTLVVPLLSKAFARLRPGGATNLERGIVEAYRMALKGYRPGGFNRVIVFTDGIAELGSKVPETILAQVESARARGITNTIVGLGGDGQERLLETLADKGDGQFIFLDSEEEAESVFNESFAAKFREVARDVKIQVEFNPDSVLRYRQVGYQNRQLSKADFRDDKVDAGEVGAGQGVTALYEMQLAPKRDSKEFKQDSIASVRIRYKLPDTMEVQEREFAISGAELKGAIELAGDRFKLACAVAEFAERLRYPDCAGVANPGRMGDVLRGAISGTYSNDAKAKELLSLINSLK